MFVSKNRCSYQLHIQLQDIKPAIWRRVVVADTTSLAQLHRIIQAAMGGVMGPLYAGPAHARSALANALFGRHGGWTAPPHQAGSLHPRRPSTA
jgi:hypothetical protein